MTLEQLIEACGDSFYSLQRSHAGLKWGATCVISREIREVDSFYGSTPTECVQKLYDYLVENKLI